MTGMMRVCHRCLEDRPAMWFTDHDGYGEVCDVCHAEAVDEDRQGKARRRQWEVIIGVAVVMAVGLGLMIAGTARVFGGSTDGGSPDGPEPLVVWEEVGGQIRRAPVPGGWLIRRDVALVFVPDAGHEWGQ